MKKRKGDPSRLGRAEVDELEYFAPGAFSKRVVTLALSIPKGRVSTYGNISRAAGGGGMAAQSITTILSRAWDEGEKTIPFHRIVYADGHIWISPRYRKERMRLYNKKKI